MLKKECVNSLSEWDIQLPILLWIFEESFQHMHKGYHNLVERKRENTVICQTKGGKR